MNIKQLIREGEGFNLEFKENYFENIGKKSLSRNNLLFGLIQRMGLVEKVGSGIIRMKKAMKNYALKEPKFDIDENWFTIIFKRQKVVFRSSEKSSEKSFSIIKKINL